jgi:hypothetical protein
MDIPVIAFTLSYIMLIWLRTNALAEYLTLFKLDRFLKVVEYNKLHSEGYDGSYLEFLSAYYSDKFIVRLVKCPVCISVWLGIFSSFFVGIKEALILAPLTLFFYTVFNRIL